MSHQNDENSQIINKAKKILKEQGYEVKTSHLYELLSKLANEASWNVAKAKGTDFNQVLAPFKDNKEIIQSTDIPISPIELVNLFLKHKDLFLFGSNGSVNMFKSPNALFVGSMGSGKTTSLKFSILSWLIGNSEKTQLCIVDSLKDTKEYDLFLKKDEVSGDPKYNVCDKIKTPDQIFRFIDVIYQEHTARQELLKENNLSSIEDYEKKNNSVITRIVVVLEEFNHFFKVLNFTNNFKTDTNSPAHKFWQLCRAGRATGIWFCATSQKGLNKDIPAEVIPCFSNIFCFRMPKSESNYLIGNPKASEITSDQKSRCVNQNSEIIQFPYLNDQQVEELLEKYIKPISSKFLLNLNTLKLNNYINDHWFKKTR